MHRVSQIIFWKRFQVLHPLTTLQKTSNNFNLTNREKEILTLISKGMNNKDIANKLVISLYTVKKPCEKHHSKARRWRQNASSNFSIERKHRIALSAPPMLKTQDFYKLKTFKKPLWISLGLFKFSFLKTLN